MEFNIFIKQIETKVEKILRIAKIKRAVDKSKGITENSEVMDKIVKKLDDLDILIAQAKKTDDEEELDKLIELDDLKEKNEEILKRYDTYTKVFTSEMNEGLADIVTSLESLVYLIAVSGLKLTTIINWYDYDNEELPFGHFPDLDYYQEKYNTEDTTEIAKHIFLENIHSDCEAHRSFAGLMVQFCNILQGARSMKNNFNFEISRLYVVLVGELGILWKTVLNKSENPLARITIPEDVYIEKFVEFSYPRISQALLITQK